MAIPLGLQTNAKIGLSGVNFREPPQRTHSLIYARKRRTADELLRYRHLKPSWVDITRCAMFASQAGHLVAWR